MVTPVDAVFVYGTLMRGEVRDFVWARHAVLQACAATVEGSLHETGQDYPVMVAGAGLGRVRGEFIRVADTQALLAELDVIEEYDPARAEGNLYVRIVVDVQAGPQARRAWTYVAGDLLHPGARIAGDDWRAYRGRAFWHQRL